MAQYARAIGHPMGAIKRLTLCGGCCPLPPLQQISRGLASAAAAREVRSGMRLGLGSGRAVAAVIAALGRRIDLEGLVVSAVAASRTSARQAQAAGISLLGEGDIEELDLGFDGADLLTEDLRLIKGGGGALVRERLVAVACRRWVIVAEEDKLRQDLRGVSLPVAVVAFGHEATARRIEAAGLHAAVRRTASGRVWRSDDGLVLYDCGDPSARQPEELAATAAALPGVVDTGYFAGMADAAYVGSPQGVRRISLRRAGGHARSGQ